jgi:hypothetical protein
MPLPLDPAGDVSVREKIPVLAALALAILLLSIGSDLYCSFFPSTDVPRKNITLASFRRPPGFSNLEPSMAKAPLQEKP